MFLLICPGLFKWAGTCRQMHSEENLISTLNGASQFPIHTLATGTDGCHCYQSWQASGRLHNQRNLLEPFIIPKWQILMISLFYKHCSFLFHIWHGSSTRLLLGGGDKTGPLKSKEWQLQRTPKVAGDFCPSSLFEIRHCSVYPN